MAKTVQAPLSKVDVDLTLTWLEENKDQLPPSIYKNISLSLKCSEAVDHLKNKIKDMIVLLSQHMGLSTKSEKGKSSKHWWRIGEK